MKILFLFTDMVRPNLLSTYNSKLSNPAPLDSVIDTLRGTLYENCYTPAPDTPRSLACLHSGQYPSKNGCDTRIKWPFYFLQSETCMLESLADEGFKLFYYATESKVQVGPLPPKSKEVCSISNSISQFENSLKWDIEEDNDSAYFLTLDDYHWGNDDFGHNSMGDYQGQKHLEKYLTSFFEKFDANDFDYIFWFSDHGHKMANEIRNPNRNMLLNSDRSQIHMLLRSKNDTLLTRDTRLRSIMDVYPTVRQIIGIASNANIDGKSLFEEHGHDYIVIEDHDDFSVSMSQVIDKWAVRTERSFYFESLDSCELYSTNSGALAKAIPLNSKKQYFSNLISKESKSYDISMKQHEILKFYTHLKGTNSDINFTDGNFRKLKDKGVLVKVLIKFIVLFDYLKAHLNRARINE
jgi:hypothetical protein